VIVRGIAACQPQSLNYRGQVRTPNRFNALYIPSIAQFGYVRDEFNLEPRPTFKMPRRISFLSLVAITFSAGFSQDISTALSSGPIPISTASPQPLFLYENALTDELLKRVLETSKTTEHAHIFAFDNGTAINQEVLKSGACKAFPGDATWPSSRLWDAFNKTIDGALIKTVPIAAPCYRNLGLYDAEKCAAIQRDFTNAYFQYVIIHSDYAEDRRT
jgi:hypothetical protein